MGFGERIALIKKIESIRGSSVITYLTSLRQNVPAQMADDAVRVAFDHLLLLPSRPIEKLDMFLCSNGGVGTVPWRLVSLFREFAKSFGVLIPCRAYSAASLLALGADEIVMHPFAELGPIDPTVSNEFNPSEAGIKDICINRLTAGSKRDRASWEEGADDMRPASEAAQGETDALFEDFEVGRALAREGVLFHPSPQALVGIQFRGIGGQTIHPQAGGVFLDRRPRFFRARGVQPIPEQEDHAGNPAPQVADEGDDLGAGDRAPYQTEIGVRVGRDRRDGRELGPVEAVVEKRRLASRSPGLAGGGQQGEAALVEEDQRSLQDLGFFSSPARGVSPNAGWRPGRVRERGGPASASSSRSGAAGGQHDRDHSAPGSGAQSDPPLAAWSRSAKRIRKPRPPARAGAEAARVERGPVSSGVRDADGGVPVAAGGDRGRP